MADNGVREPVHIDIELTVLCEYIKLRNFTLIWAHKREFCNCKPSLVENHSCAIESTKKKFHPTKSPQIIASTYTISSSTIHHLHPFSCV